MLCPVCGGASRVMATRSDCDGVYRRRKCKECNHVFFTNETDSDGAELKRIESLQASESRIRQLYAN